MSYNEYMKSIEEAEKNAKNMSWEQLIVAFMDSCQPAISVYGSFLSGRVRTMPNEDIPKLIEFLKIDENWRVIDYIHNSLDSRGYPTELVSDPYHSPHYLMKGWSYDKLD
ncbi:MAG: hypothetical protein ACI4WH_07555 [Oscillospiraceae bacterium]